MRIEDIVLRASLVNKALSRLTGTPETPTINQAVVKAVMDTGDALPNLTLRDVILWCVVHSYTDAGVMPPLAEPMHLDVGVPVAEEPAPVAAPEPKPRRTRKKTE